MWQRRERAEPVSGLRTRYVPRSRLGQGVLSMAPWLDLVLLVVFFVLLKNSYVIEPGVSIELPRVPTQGGTRPGLVAVVLSLETAQSGSREEVVVFNDQRYRVANVKQMELLQRDLARFVGRGPTGILTLEADARVLHGTLVRLFAMARTIGLNEVNVATRDPTVRKAAGQGGR